MDFKCPVCGERHFVQDNYDKEDYDCPNDPATRISPRTFQNLPPEDLMTRNAPNMNRKSTKIDEARPATIVNLQRDYKFGERVSRQRKNTNY